MHARTCLHTRIHIHRHMHKHARVNSNACTTPTNVEQQEFPLRVSLTKKKKEINKRTFKETQKQRNKQNKRERNNERNNNNNNTKPLPLLCSYSSSDICNRKLPAYVTVKCLTKAPPPPPLSPDYSFLLSVIVSNLSSIPFCLRVRSVHLFTTARVTVLTTHIAQAVAVFTLTYFVAILLPA